MGKPLIIGEGTVHVAPAFWDVQQALDGYDDVVLFAQMAQVIGQEIPKNSIIYNLDPLYDGSNLTNIGFLDVLREHRVVDYQKKNVEYLHSKGIWCEHMPYGWHKGLERVKPAEEDIDVLFFGGVSDRRIKKLKELERSGMNVKIITYGCYGEELDEVVARSKVIMNMHYFGIHPLQVVRINYLMANEKMIVSERGWDEEENEMYSGGLAFCDYDDLIETCRHYVNEADERKHIAANGKRIIRQMKMDLSPLERAA